MFKTFSIAVLAGASSLGLSLSSAAAVEVVIPVTQPRIFYSNQPEAQPAPTRVAYAERPNMGGGFIEFLFSGEQPQRRSRYPVQQMYEPQPAYAPGQTMYAPQGIRQQQTIDPARPGLDPKYEKQLVEYHGKERAGTIVIDTPNKFLYLVQGDGSALRYGIGVGRPGFTWSGVKTISAKKEWPAWTPPKEMLARRPDLPRHMEGGPENPLGARAMYLGSTLYRIHGSNEPWTIGTNVSSGCIRMRNEDVIDLYGRVSVGARVVVI